MSESYAQPAGIVVCPKAPDENILRQLIRANLFIEHARSHSISGLEFDNMIAIHNLDNAVEYMLRILIGHFDVENLVNKNFETCELASLVGEFAKFAKDNGMPVLPHAAALKTIRSQRNLVQHGMINPVADIRMSMQHVDKFFDNSLQRYFGITKQDLQFSCLVTDLQVKNKLQEAEKAIVEGRYLDAVVNSRDAFDYALFTNSLYQHEKLWRSPGIAETKEKFSELTTVLSDMFDMLLMSSRAVDMGKYYRYKEYMDYIPAEHRKDTAIHRELTRDWNKADADFCYGFVCNTLLTWQSIDTTEIDLVEPRENPYEFKWKFENIDCDATFEEYSCMFALNQKLGRLFYVDSKDKADVIIEHARKGLILESTERKKDGVTEFKTEEIEQVLGYDYRLVINDPETWEIFLLFIPAPFTHKNLLEPEKSIDIDTLEGNDRHLFDDLNDSDVEAANELRRQLIEKHMQPDQYYSSSFIEKLRTASQQ